jgi:hypothetical protein
LFVRSFVDCSFVCLFVCLLKTLTQIEKKGEIITNEKTVAEEAKTFFQKLYEKQENRDVDYKPWKNEEYYRNISFNGGEELTREISLQELKNTIQEMPNNKSGGTDQIPYKLLKLWDDEILETVRFEMNVWMMEKKIPKNWKEGKMILLKKPNGTNEINTQRPITLLKTIYKIWSKILTTRINYYMDQNNVIQKRTQSGFAKEREIQTKIENLIMIIEDAKEHNKDIAILTTDISKAFDSIDWTRIEENMELLKFPKEFIKIIMEMLNNAETRIEIGNTMSEAFEIERGTRQGDPISPAMYNVFIEPMLRWLDIGDTKGYQIGKMQVKIGAVADDMVIYGKSRNELQRSLNKIETYLNSANVFLNPKKCDYISNIKEDKNKSIVAKSGEEIRNKGNEPIRYLGVWLTINLNFGYHWKLIDEKYKDAINRIKKQPISITEKASCINVMATTTILYGSALLKIPETLIKKWESMAKKVLKKEGNLARCVNNIIYTSTEEGGIGLRTISSRIEQEQMRFMKV